MEKYIYLLQYLSGILLILILCEFTGYNDKVKKHVQKVGWIKSTLSGPGTLILFWTAGYFCLYTFIRLLIFFNVMEQQ